MFRLLAVLLCLALSLPSAAASHDEAPFQAITLFGCDASGTQDGHNRWNAGPHDAACDIFMYMGEVAQSLDAVEWMNDPQTHLVAFGPPSSGSTTYTLHIECTSDIEHFGLNLFGPDRGRPVTSVYTPVTHDASKPSSFKINRSARTMGWPITDVPACGSATARCERASLWTYAAGDAKQYTLTDFRILSPAAAGHVDFVGPHQTGPSGKADYVFQFTLSAEDAEAAPPDWLLWTDAVGGMPIGSNDPDGAWKKRYDWQNAAPPFSFVFDGRPSRELLRTWTHDARHEVLDPNRIAHTLTWRDSQTGLIVRWQGLEYTDFESIEWTVYLANGGDEDTPIGENLKALDAQFTRAADCEYRLRHWNGTSVGPEDFAPAGTMLEAGRKLSFASRGGRGTGGSWPYYNLETGDEGIILAVGWPGQWHADFQRDDGAGLHITAGQESTHFRLRPGETVRTPLIVMQFWKGGDWIDAQNTWRRWMVRHNLPRRKGRPLPLPMFCACSSHQFAEMTKADERSQIEFMDRYLDKGLKLDYWWMDAGWYVGAAEKGWAAAVGTWEIDRRPHRFPNGFRPISDHAHSRGVEIIVWFEPERVHAGTWLAENHPEWVLGGSGGGLLNLGDPDAWNWLVNHIDKIITEEGIDLYRQDYNIEPLNFWRRNDTADRQGITENKYVTGYLAYWDELLRRHPGMVIDSCASGGHRNDLETMRRSVPLLRSDYLFEPVGQQGHTYGLSFWLPFYGTGYCPSNTVGWGWGTGELSYNPYTRRSNMCPANIGLFDFRAEVDDELILKLYREWLEVAPAFLGDYYPLTDYNLSQQEWIAWQFDRPDAGTGFVQAFRRESCIYSSAEIKLRGLDAAAVYEVRDFDAADMLRLPGRKLLEAGLPIRIPAKPGAVTVRYTKVP